MVVRDAKRAAILFLRAGGSDLSDMSDMSDRSDLSDLSDLSDRWGVG